MRELAYLIINPMVILYLLLLVGLVLLVLKRKHSGKIMLTLALLWFFIVSTPFLPKLLIKSLENKYSQLSDSILIELQDTCNIIVLGGGHTDDKNLSPNNQLSLQALSRLVEGIRIHRRLPGSKLILSGYRGRSELPQALVLYRTALILGIDSSSMAMQTQPSNTFEEAEEYVKNYGTNKSLILVTSAHHMPRAIMLFTKAGIIPVPSPTNFRLKYGSGKHYLSIIPSEGYIGLMEVAIHEYLGIIWAKLGGK